MKVIDISHWQNDRAAINWTKVKNDNVKAVIVKGTEGKTYTDSYFIKNVDAVHKVGLGVGAYHFARFKSTTEAIAEAKYFVSKTKGKAFEWGLWLDLEVNPGNLNKTNLTNASIEFLKILKNAGHKIGIYVNLNYYNNLIDYARIKKETGALLWVARYRSKSLGAGIKTDIWQYTDKGTVDGISGGIDVNEAYTDIGKIGTTTSTSPSTPTPTTPTTSKFVKPPVFEGKADFISYMKNFANQAAIATNIPFEVVLGQWVKECLWGRSGLAQTGNNFAGIRYTSNADFNNNGWSGYNTIANFIKDYIRVMKLSYYADVRNAVSVKDTCIALGKSPYSADDPEYGIYIYEKIIVYNKFSEIVIDGKPIEVPVVVPPVVVEPDPVPSVPYDPEEPTKPVEPEILPAEPEASIEAPKKPEAPVELIDNFFSKYGIDRSKKPKKISMFLKKPNGVTIGKLNESYNVRLLVKFNELNELSFSIPYKVERRKKLVRNPLIDKIRERFLVKVVYGDIEETFMIRKKVKSSSDVDTMNIECFSLGYELRYANKMIGYNVISVSCITAMTACLKDTNWKVGYINPELNLPKRNFDVSSQTKLDFLYDIARTFEGIVTFDTENRYVHMWKEEELSSYKGFWITYGKYLQTIEDTTDIEEVVTRLQPVGSDDLRINSINPTGEMWIDDFSYYMYPFEVDSDGNVIESSYFMDDDLCLALIKYNQKIDNNKVSFYDLLAEKKKEQEVKTTENNTLTTLKSNLKIILDDIEVAKTTGSSTTDLNKKRDSKKLEITKQEEKINGIQLRIDKIDSTISELKEDLNLENNIGEALMFELKKFIHFEDWSDDNIIDENDLYEAAVKHLKEVNSPPINISLGIVNFFDVVEEQRNWDRLNIGDIIKIKHEQLGVDVEAKIAEISFDFESGSINLGISNGKKIKTVSDEIKEMAYTIKKVNTDYNIRKQDFIKNARNTNLRNDRLSETPANPMFKNNGTEITSVMNDNGTVNLTVSWMYSDYNISKNNADNVDGFYLYLYSSNLNEKYTFGSTMGKEQVSQIDDPNSRTYTHTGIPANLYYTVGIQAYRRVDEDVNSDGILLSDVISPAYETSDPYRPAVSVQIKGEVVGKINGSKIVTDTEEPLNPENKTVWNQITPQGSVVTKVFSESQGKWIEQSTSNSSTVGQYSPDVNKTANTIPVRDATGNINGVASLDTTSNVPHSQLGNASRFAFGEYTGDGTQSRAINIGFTPTLVKVYTTNSADNSLFIPSMSGGFLLSTLNNFVYLQSSGGLNVPSLVYGAIVLNGFKTGSSNFGNTLNTKYYWEAYKNPITN